MSTNDSIHTVDAALAGHELPLPTSCLRIGDLRFATRRIITALWVIAYTIDINDGTAHIFSHSRNPEFADREFEMRWPTYQLELDEDEDVTRIRIISTGGECRWEVSNPRASYEYDAHALVELALAGRSGGAR